MDKARSLALQQAVEEALKVDSNPMMETGHENIQAVALPAYVQTGEMHKALKLSEQALEL